MSQSHSGAGIARARDFTVWISSFLLEALTAWFWDNSNNCIWLFVSRKCWCASEFKNHVFWWFWFCSPSPAHFRQIYLASLRWEKKCFLCHGADSHGSILAAYFPLNPAILLDEIFILSTPTGYPKQLHHRTRWCRRSKAHTKSLHVMKIHHKFQKLKKYHKISSHFVPAIMIFILKGFC